MLPTWSRLILALVLVVSAARPLRAEPASEIHRVLVYADGPRARAILAELARDLPPGAHATPANLAFILTGAHAATVKAALATDKSRTRLAASVQRALTQTSNDAAILAHPEPGRAGQSRTRLFVVVRDDPTPREEEVVLGSEVPSGARRAKWRDAIASALASEPAEAEEPPAAPPAEEPSASTAKPGTSAAGAANGAGSQPAGRPSAGAGAGAGAAPTPDAAAAGRAPASADGELSGDSATATSSASSSAAAGSSTGTRYGSLPSEPSPRRPSWITVGVDGTWNYRRFELTEAIWGSKRRYIASGIAGVGATLELYPFAGGSGVMRDLGVVAHGFLAPSFSSRAPGALPPATAPAPSSSSWYGFDAALHARIRTKPLILGFGLGYGMSVFDFDLQDLPDRTIPRGNYSMGRAGFDLRVPIGPFAVLASATYLHVFSIRRLSNYSASTSSNGLRPKGFGVEGTFGLAYQPVSVFELRAGAQYEGIFYDADTRPIRTGTPGSVHDESFGLSVGARLIF